jgi:hypothetical protein
MDAFEAIVAQVLERDGYWVKRSVKVHCSADEKKQFGGGPSTPTPEIDIVAFKHHELILFEVKSFLFSTGVKYAGVTGANAKDGKKYKIVNNPAFQRIMTEKLTATLAVPKNVTVKYGLAAGKIATADLQPIRSHFSANPQLVLLTPEDLASKLAQFSDSIYISDHVTLLTKLFDNQGMFKKA